MANKAEALAKSQSTRSARHTMGSTQKEDVKGDVTGIVITPVTASTPAAATPTTPAVATSTPAGPATAAATPAVTPPTHGT